MRKLLCFLMVIFATNIQKSLQTIQTDTFKNLQTFNYLFYKSTNNDFLHYLTENLLEDQYLELGRIFQLYEKYDATLYEVLILEKNKIIILPNNFFSNTTDITFLSLRDNKIKKIEEGAFKNLKNLILLLLDDNELDELSSSTFAYLYSLRFLRIDNNNLKKLPGDIFVKNTNLKIISLNENSFRSLPEGLFKNNKNLFRVNVTKVANLTYLPNALYSNNTSLQFVYLNNCSLTLLPENLFQGSINILLINLENNALQTLPDKIFQGLESLEKLTINNNQIEILPENLFQSCSNLRSLYLSGNNIITINWSLFRALYSLDTLYIDHNKISNFVIDFFVCTYSVKHINLSHNNISDLNPNSFCFLQSVFNHHLSLETLDLSHNKLQSVSKNWIKEIPSQFLSLNLAHNEISSLTADDLNIPLQRQFTLDLSNNKISEIDLQNYKETLHKMVINVESNPLKCNCHLYDVLRYSNNSSSNIQDQKLRILTGSSKCVGFNEYQDILMSNINLKEYKCVPEEKEINDYNMCPNTCNVQKRPADKKLLLDCSNRNLTHAPETLCSLKDLNSSIDLDLTGNKINKFPNLRKVGYDKVMCLILSQNEISTIPEDIFFNTTLKILALDNNQLGTLSANVIKKISSSVQSIQLGNNPWNCRCEALDLRRFILTENLIVDVGNIHCQNSTLLLKNTVPEKLCTFKTFCIISSAIIFSALAFFCYCYRKDVKFCLFFNNLYQWFFMDEDPDTDKPYDAFISHCYEDEEFVIKELVTNLENGERSYKLCLRFRDWVVGGWIPDLIAKSIQDSKRTIIVLSPNFLRSVWARMELKISHKEALIMKKSRTIIILYGDISQVDKLDPELQTYLQMNTFVKWGDPWFWNKLRFALPHKSDVSSKVRKPSNIESPHPSKQLGFNN